jgi:hypothetical protein
MIRGAEAEDESSLASEATKAAVEGGRGAGAGEDTTSAACDLTGDPGGRCSRQPAEQRFGGAGGETSIRPLRKVEGRRAP